MSRAVVMRRILAAATSTLPPASERILAPKAASEQPSPERIGDAAKAAIDALLAKHRVGLETVTVRVDWQLGVVRASGTPYPPF